MIFGLQLDKISQNISYRRWQLLSHSDFGFGFRSALLSADRPSWA
ncbi:hypothetical protein [Microlunatus sp. Gsoil 973]|nr:hypothetical protein [Microlunatus sp. Gsoil 973]